MMVNLSDYADYNPYDLDWLIDRLSHFEWDIEKRGKIYCCTVWLRHWAIWPRCESDSIPGAILGAYKQMVKVVNGESALTGFRPQTLDYQNESD